jgi:DNA-3-methyladenine glycosylase
MIDKNLNGHDLHHNPLKLLAQPQLPASAITQTTRIGISRAQDQPWRFYVTGNAYVSKPSD